MILPTPTLPAESADTRFAALVASLALRTLDMLDEALARLDAPESSRRWLDAARDELTELEDAR